MVLRSPEGLLAALVLSADEAILAKDLDGTIVAWNPAAERLYGYSAQEAIGQPVEVIVPPDRPTEMPDILARIRRGERIEHFQTVRRRKDGTLVEVSVTISPVLDDGVPIGASSIARDIGAERRRAERDRWQAMLVHDHIVQGVAIAKMALETGDTPRALQALTESLAAAKDVVSNLLADVSLDPVDLRAP